MLARLPNSAQLLLIYLFDSWFGRMFNKDALESLKRITYLILNNVIDTRFEVAQGRLFLSHSSLRLTSFCAKGNGYPEPFPHQPCGRPINGQSGCDSKTAYPAQRTK